LREHQHSELVGCNHIFRFQPFVEQKGNSLHCDFVQLVLFDSCFWTQGTCALLPQAQSHFLSHEPITPRIRGRIEGRLFRWE
jgi:hypothetical protein